MNYKLDIPRADEFIRNLEEYIEKVNDICLDVISERLRITREQAEELAKSVQDEALDEYLGEQWSKNFRIE